MWSYHNLLIYFSVGGHWGFVQSLAILEDDAQNIPVRAFWMTYALLFPGPTAGSGTGKL